jgi:hypothetical protein
MTIIRFTTRCTVCVTQNWGNELNYVEPASFPIGVSFDFSITCLAIQEVWLTLLIMENSG